MKRSLKEATIEQHLLQAAIENLHGNWESVLPIEYLEAIHKVKEEIGAEKLKPLKEALPGEISYFQIKLALTLLS